VSASSVWPSKIRTGTRSTIHIDDDFLRDSTVSNSILAELLVHEGLHFAFPNHGENEGPVYTTYPYSEAASCVKQP
jgi:hypothetical protein